MNKLIKISGILLVFAILITACGNHSNREKRLASADSLIIVLDKVDSMLNNEFKYDSIMLRFNVIKETQEALGPFILKFSQKEKSDFNQFSGCEKQFKNSIASYESFKNELVYSKKQINDLKSDFKNKAIKKEKFDDFFSTESKAVYDLFNSVKAEIYKLNMNSEKFFYFSPIMDKLMIDKGIKKSVSGNNKSEVKEDAEDD